MEPCKIVGANGSVGEAWMGAAAGFDLSKRNLGKPCLWGKEKLQAGKVMTMIVLIHEKAWSVVKIRTTSSLDPDWATFFSIGTHLEVEGDVRLFAHAPFTVRLPIRNVDLEGKNLKGNFPGGIYGLCVTKVDLAINAIWKHLTDGKAHILVVRQGSTSPDFHMGFILPSNYRRRRFWQLTGRPCPWSRPFESKAERAGIWI